MKSKNKQFHKKEKPKKNYMSNSIFKKYSKNFRQAL